jgi:hypothetical protein
VDLPEEEDWDRQPGVDPELSALSHLLGLVRGIPLAAPDELEAHLLAVAEAVDLYDDLRSLEEGEERDQLIIRLEELWGDRWD